MVIIMTEDEFKSYYEGIFSEISSLSEKRDALESAKNKLSDISYHDIGFFKTCWSLHLSNIDEASEFEGKNEKEYISKINEDIFPTINSYQASILDILDTLESEISRISRKIEELESEAQNTLREEVFG